jgi:hypothetical protein
MTDAELRAAAERVVARYDHAEYRGTAFSDVCLKLARTYLARPLALWTSEPPTVPGWYWWRLTQKSKPRIVEVPEGGVMAGFVGEWLGPLEPSAPPLTRERVAAAVGELVGPYKSGLFDPGELTDRLCRLLGVE